MSDIKIIENFLEKKDFQFIKDKILDNYFPWFFQENKERYFNEDSYERGKKDLTQYQYTHNFYEDYEPRSNYFNILYPLFKKLNVKSLIRVKANLNPYSKELVEGYFHKDYVDYNSYTAVFYVNTNNGYTLFKDKNKKILSEENKIVIFNSNVWHKGTNTNNNKRRVVLNINYF